MKILYEGVNYLYAHLLCLLPVCWVQFNSIQLRSVSFCTHVNRAQTLIFVLPFPNCVQYLQDCCSQFTSAIPYKINCSRCPVISHSFEG